MLFYPNKAYCLGLSDAYMLAITYQTLQNEYLNIKLCILVKLALFLAKEIAAAMLKNLTSGLRNVRIGLFYLWGGLHRRVASLFGSSWRKCTKSA